MNTPLYHLIKLEIMAGIGKVLLSFSNILWRATHRKLKELLREPRESLGHLAPSPTNKAITININV